jgi:hypothetical protein
MRDHWAERTSSSFSLLIGLVRCISAPDSKHSGTASLSSHAVTVMMTQAGSRPRDSSHIRMFRIASKPSISGINRSMRIKSYLRRLTIATATAPFSASSVSKIVWARNWRSSVRLSSASSTMSTEGLGLLTAGGSVPESVVFEELTLPEVSGGSIFSIASMVDLPRRYRAFEEGASLEDGRNRHAEAIQPII